jgi:hypothetical protein
MTATRSLSKPARATADNVTPIRPEVGGPLTRREARVLERLRQLSPERQEEIQSFWHDESLQRLRRAPTPTDLAWRRKEEGGQWRRTRWWPERCGQ